MAKDRSFVQGVRDLIGQDDLPEAVRQLSALLENSPRLNEAVLQSARYSDVMKQIRLGLVDFQSANITKNQIRFGLLELLRDIEEREREPEIQEELARYVINVEKNAIINSSLHVGGSLHVGDVIQYGERKILRLLTSPPFNPPVFIGREADMAAIEKNFAAVPSVLLLNGDGGMGKTSLAAKYWIENQGAYQHLAWIFADSGVGDALLSLAPKLGIQFDPTEAEASRINRLVEAVNNLAAPCLIVLDNANNPEDLAKHAMTLGALLNCHLLITSRVDKLFGAATLRLQHLQEKDAADLFKTHYPKYAESDAPLLHSLLRAVGFNTLVVELLSKNLAVFNEFRPAYSLQTMLADLQQQGLFAIQHKKVEVAYQSASLRAENPKDVISAMYDLSGLPESEKSLLSNFAVLLAENIPYVRMAELLKPDDPEQFDETLRALRQKGWIEIADAGLKVSPVVQEIVKLKNQDALLEDCEILIDTLNDKLDSDVIHQDNYQPARIFSRYAEAVVYAFQEPDHNVGVLCERLGRFHTATGDLLQALAFYEQSNRLTKELYTAYPNNADFKNGLANSYEKLGNSHSALGSLDQALTFYEEQNRLAKELYIADPNNVSFKNGLAISHEKLGTTHSALGDLEQALAFYEKDIELSKELYTAYPNNVSFKNGLAISYCFLGITHSALGYLEQALAFYEEYNHLENELYTAYPNNVDFKNGLAASYSKLGETHSALGSLEQAQAFYEDFNKLMKELYSAYPNNVDFKNGVAISYSKLGNTHSALGSLDQALAFYEKETQLFDELYAAYPNYISFKNGLAVSYSKLGETQSALGDLEQALAFYKEYNRLEKELYTAYPNNVSFKNSLAISYSKLGETHSALGFLDQALAFYEEYNRLEKELYSAYTNNVKFKNGLAISYEKLGETRSALGFLDQALAFYEKDIELTKELYFAYPNNVSFKNSLAVSYSKLGETQSALGDLEQALAFYEEYNRLKKELYTAYPNNMDFKNGLAISYSMLGYFYKDKKNDLDKARFYYEQCEKLHSELATAFPDYIEFQDRLKWVKNALSKISSLALFYPTTGVAGPNKKYNGFS